MSLTISKPQLAASNIKNLRRLARSLGLDPTGRPKKLPVADILDAMRRAEMHHEIHMRAKRRADAEAAFSVRDSRASSQEAT